MRYQVLSCAAALAVSSTAFAQGRVVITEIMYNPASTEKNNETEWIEIANVGTESIEIKDWTLRIGDKKTRWGTISCTLAPGSVAVLVNAVAVSEEQFRAAWDTPGEPDSAAPALAYQVIPIQWGALSNNPAVEHPLQLVNETSEVQCEVKFSPDRPRVKGGGASVYLTDPKTADINSGNLWKVSLADQGGARKCIVAGPFDKEDIGSPGYVPGVIAGAPPSSKPPAAPDADKPKSDDVIDY